MAAAEYKQEMLFTQLLAVKHDDWKAQALCGQRLMRDVDFGREKRDGKEGMNAGENRRNNGSWLMGMRVN